MAEAAALAIVAPLSIQTRGSLPAMSVDNDSIHNSLDVPLALAQSRLRPTTLGLRYEPTRAAGHRCWCDHRARQG
jgi:hypothetical protein